MQTGFRSFGWILSFIFIRAPEFHGMCHLSFSRPYNMHNEEIIQHLYQAGFQTGVSIRSMGKHTYIDLSCHSITPTPSL